LGFRLLRSGTNAQVRDCNIAAVIARIYSEVRKRANAGDSLDDGREQIKRKPAPARMAGHYEQPSGPTDSANGKNSPVLMYHAN
jgi:hypothetical protein